MAKKPLEDVPVETFYPSEIVDIETLRPWPRNYKIHGDDQTKAVGQSLSDFGQFKNVVVWRGPNDNFDFIVAGHGLVESAKLKGWQRVDVKRLPSTWSIIQVEAALVADNRLAELSQTDEEKLANLLQSIRQENPRMLEPTGFDGEQVDALLRGLASMGDPGAGGTDTEPQIDKSEELRQKWNVEPGQMWQLGEHRIICGDCTDRAVVERVMGGEKADLCLTDPPYGIGDTVSDKNEYDDYDDTKENLAGLISKFLPIAQDIANVVVLTLGNGNHRLYPSPLWTMAWFTPAGSGSGPWGFCCWQPILCYGKDPKLSGGKGRYPDAIVHTESSEDLSHPCPKPIKFWEWLMNRTSEEGEIIYEPFSGSGTTLIACENLNRRCRAVEISPAYVAVAIERWADHTGKEPVLIPHGER